MQKNNWLNLIKRSVVSSLVFFITLFSIAFAATSITSITQTVNSGDSITATWYQAVNDTLSSLSNDKADKTTIYTKAEVDTLLSNMQADLTIKVWTISKPWTSCKDILDNWWSIWNAVYRINAWWSAIQMYCDMTTDWWGWTLLVNLNTSDTTTRKWSDWFWTDSNNYWNIGDIYSVDYKNSLWLDNVKIGNNIMVIAHNQGIIQAYSKYSVLSSYQTMSLWNLFKNYTDITLTWNATTTKFNWITPDDNPDRNAGEWADVFIDKNMPLVINSTNQCWSNSNCDDTHKARIATTYQDSTSYSHTFAWIWWYHTRSTRLWEREASPIYQYCDSGTPWYWIYWNRWEWDAFNSSSCTKAATSKEVDFAIMVR